MARKEKNNKNSNILYFVLALGLLVALGFLGYYFGFLQFIYRVMMPGQLSNYNLIFLSAIFGIAAFFSPCAFSVLPAYVSHYLAGETREGTRLAKVMYFGLIAALGVVTVNLVIGLVIAALGAATPFAKDPRQDIPLILGIRVVAGLAIVVLGVMTLLGKSINLHFLSRFVGKQSFSKSMYFYGVVYNAAALGCTGPIILGLMLYAFASGSFPFAIAAFVIFSLTMGALMLFLTMLSAFFKQAIMKKIAAATTAIKNVAAIVMILTGLAIVVLTLEGNNWFVKIFFPYLG